MIRSNDHSRKSSGNLVASAMRSAALRRSAISFDTMTSTRIVDSPSAGANPRLAGEAKTMSNHFGSFDIRRGKVGAKLLDRRHGKRCTSSWGSAMTKRKYLYRKPDPKRPEIVRVYFRHPKNSEADAASSR